MIANRGFGRWRGKSSFDACIRYITREGEREPALAAWAGGVSSIATAAFEMESLASQSRVVDPVYHLIVSWGPDERPSLDRVREALDEQLDRLGLEGLQFVASIHDDGVGGMLHAHVALNRVDPLTLHGRSIWRDQVVMREVCRDVERNDGWRVVGDENADTRGEEPGEDRGEERAADEPHQERAAGRERSRPGSNAQDPYGVRAKFRAWVREHVKPALERALAEADGTWQRLAEVLAADQLRYEVVSSFGARIVGTISGWAVGLGEIGLRHRDLVEKFGEWVGGWSRRRRDRDEDLGEQVGRARVVVEDLDDDVGWTGVHDAFRALGLGIEKRSNGARIVDLDGPGWHRVDRDDPVLSLGSLSKRFGPYRSSEDEGHREGLRDVLRRAENLVAAEHLVRDPSPIYTTLFHTKSVITFDELRKDVDRRVFDNEQRTRVLRSALDGMLAVEIGGQALLTTPLVQSEERAAARAAGGLASGHLRAAITRPSGDGLDDQQRAAYAYATERSGRLKVITGVPGAGKTTLLSEIAAAYSAAGYRVRGAAVANSAVEVMRRETSIPARSVAKELYEWRREDGRSARERLTARDVVFVDEVSTLGTEQGGALLAEAARAGAVLIALGDDKQFQAVARGDALRIMQQAVGDRRIDLKTTRRQREAWQREATHAVRRGDVASALDAYRNRGAIRESATQAEARAALVSRWGELESTGVEVGIETYTNQERRALNELARAKFRELGRLSGPDVVLETMDGKTPYAVGERVTIRETIHGVGLVNGSAVTVRGMRGAVLDVERRDGAVVSIDTREHPGVQHGYASTEFREQGATRYAELQLLTRQVNQRSLTVGMTRHTHEFTAFYSREEFKRGYRGVVELGQRTQQKALVLDGVERGSAREVFGSRVEQAVDHERDMEMAR